MFVLLKKINNYYLFKLIDDIFEDCFNFFNKFTKRRIKETVDNEFFQFIIVIVVEELIGRFCFRHLIH
jgi:hypothetical protein